MKLSTDRILTTHAGSLPRPPELESLMFDVADGKPYDEALVRDRVREAVRAIVARQREAGIDVVSDGEMGKIGFSGYVTQRFGGYGDGGQADVQMEVADLSETPDLSADLYNEPGWEHVTLPPLVAPLSIPENDYEFFDREIEDLRSALGDDDPDGAFLPAVTPGQAAFNLPNAYGVYPTHEAYVRALADALAPEYRAIVGAGFNLQLDSPDAAAAFHHSFADSDLGDPRVHLETSIGVLNETLRDLPAEKLRYHVCWGNYRGTHHRDIEMREIIELVLTVKAQFISIEAANPRHEHEWEVWRDVKLPDDKALIVGVIDTKTNHVEHPRLIAQRLRRFADLVGKERVIAGTDCGFSTFVGARPCAPEAAWLKLQALSEGAQLASDELW